MLKLNYLRKKNFNIKLIALCFLILFFFGNWKCKKKKSDTGTPAISSSWKVGTTSYSATNLARNTNYALSTSDGTNNSGIAIYFAAFPTASGSFQVAKYSSSGNPSGSLSANQISIDAILNGGTDDYLSTGSEKANATVTVSGGKITVTLPAIWGQHNNQNGEQPDSLQISGSFIEN